VAAHDGAASSASRSDANSAREITRDDGRGTTASRARVTTQSVPSDPGTSDSGSPRAANASSAYPPNPRCCVGQPDATSFPSPSSTACSAGHDGEERESISTDPSARTTSASSNASPKRPYASDRDPHALVPTRPPTRAHRDEVTSGPIITPDDASEAFRSSSTTPAPAQTESPSSETAPSPDVSRIHPEPRHWPATLDPPARAVTGTPAEAAAATQAATSDASLAIETASGSTTNGDSSRA
jgi:hypothetical protein